MSGFRRFEEIQAWQKVRIATRRINEITSDGRFSKDFSLRGQIQRSAVSIMANIAEGQGRFSNKEFANFLNMAYGSAAETKSHLYFASNLEYINPANFSEPYDLVCEVSRMTVGLIKHLRAS